MSEFASRLLELNIPDVEHSFDANQTILYALGVGVGADPLSARQLRYVYEADLSPLPSMAVVLGHPGFWPRDLDCGLDWRRIVHGEQTLALHRPLPVRGRVRASSRVIGVQDKGADRGCVVNYERRIWIDDEPTAVVGQTLFCRGDGGKGSIGEALPALPATPERKADVSQHLRTLPQAALIYRLSGDLNPLHADPAAARHAGFERPILHGLATYGAAAFCLLEAMETEPQHLRRLDCRFRAPVFPGDLLETSVWREANGIHFSVRAPDRDVDVISHGYAEFSDVSTQTGS